MRHQAAVTYISLIHIGMGLSIILSPHDIRVPDHAILFEMMAWWVRSALWVSFGLVAAILIRTKWHRASWVVLSVMPAQRIAGHFWSALMYIIPGVPGGLASAFGDMLIWLALLLLLRHLASWPDLRVIRKVQKP